VENAELEVALEELESRLERLRALYEQYFMGIERIEPAIPRKDIDRRIYVLRREKIRNTAKRFKLQTIISRYNTFQQYWQRICREIEQGTYKRHVIKAERIAPGQILTIAARKRLGRAALQAMEPEEATAAAPSAPPSASPSELPASPVAAVTPGTRLAPPPKPGAVAPPGKPAPPAKPAPPPKPGARPVPATDAPAAAARAPTAPPVPAPPARAPAAPTRAPAPAAPAAKAKFESLDLDMDFLGDWDPSASPAKVPAAKRVPEAPARPFGKSLSKPMGTPPAPPAGAKPAKLPSVRPTRPGMGANDPAAPPRAVAPPSAPPPKPVTIPPRPATSPMVSKPLAPRPPAPPPAAAKPLGAIIPGTAPAKPLPPQPAAPPAAAAPAADDRVRELHARLVEAKRQTQDASAVSMEGLAKSMKATEAKLREQHKNRKIDFDVVIKDGKAVLKPIVR